MTDKELKNTIDKLRSFTGNKRQLSADLPQMSSFLLNVIEIACCLTELGLSENKPISTDNEYWFEGSYHMNFWNSDIETQLYSPLVSEVRQRIFFRKGSIN